MRKPILCLMLLSLLASPCLAMEYTAPQAPPDVQELVPYQPESFGEGLWKVLKGGISWAMPDMAAAGGLCLSVIALFLLVSVLKGIGEQGAKVPEWVLVLVTASVMPSQTNTLIRLGVDTVRQMSEYGKLLLPVMTSALAAQGGISSSGALYLGTVVFDSLLISAVSALLIPMTYLFLALAVGFAATGEEIMGKWKAFLKWVITWSLKISLYVFTGYMTITGVVSGTADQTVVKATKLTISGMVPVVGGILADASETVVVGAGVMKNAAGMYGFLAILAIWITPFLRIGIQYLLLKVTASFCSGFGLKHAGGLVNDFSDAMGLMLAMTGTACVFLLISIVCFMKGMG